VLGYLFLKCHLYVCVYIHTHTHTYIYIYTHLHIHIHIHTHTDEGLKGKILLLFCFFNVQTIFILILLPSCQQTCMTFIISDDGQRNCPKRVEFYSKNKFEKLIYLVCFKLRIFYKNYSVSKKVNAYLVNKYIR